MKEALKLLKVELKVLASQIRDLKSKRKDTNFNNGCGYVNGLDSAQERFRTKHIARCLIRGTPMDKIEGDLRNPSDPKHSRIYKQADQIVERVKKGEYGKENIRPGGQEPVKVAASSSIWSCIGKLCK